MKLSVIILFFITNQLTGKKAIREKKHNCHPVAGCCPCGQRNEKEIQGDKACKESVDAHKATNDRIVGGCEAGGIIPWYALLVLTTPNSINRPKCGGVLINRLWVATAAHCFHTTSHNVMDRDKHGKWIIQMPFKHVNESANIYIGITKYSGAMCIPGGSCSPSHRKYLIEELYLHPKFKRKHLKLTYGYDRSDYDIALIRLDYPVAGNDNDKSEKIGRHPTFRPDVVMPICLPRKDYKDEERQAMAAGMGITATKQSACYTNERGPEMFTKCAKRFRYYNENKRDDFGEWENYFEKTLTMPCVKKLWTIPSRKLNPLCKKFRLNHIKTLEEKKNNGTVLSKEDELKLNLTADEAILIAKKNITYCFPTDFPEKSPGWCGTCVANARKNTPGYCAEGKDQTAEETSIVQPYEGWGFCDISCHLRNNIFTSTVKKVKLTTFNSSFCMDIGTRVNESLLFIKEDDPFIVNVRIELCAGHINKLESNSFSYNSTTEDFTFIKDKKRDYRKMSTSKRRQSRSDYKSNRRAFRSIRLKNNPNLPNPDLAEKGFVMGGEDTCQGDSGGPLYVMDPEGENVDKLKQKATLIGLVSRGSGCAQKNFPGIYTRIKRHLGYLYKTIQKSGKEGVHTYKRRGRDMDAFTNRHDVKEGEEVEVSPFCVRKKKKKRRSGRVKRKKKKRRGVQKRKMKKRRKKKRRRKKS